MTLTEIFLALIVILLIKRELRETLFAERLKVRIRGYKKRIKNRLRR